MHRIALSLLVCTPFAFASGLTVAEEPVAPAAEVKPGDATPQKHRPRVRIGKETTFVTEPLDAEGNVDFIAALNDRASAGVTVENNAAIPFWQIVGPKIIDAKVRAEFFQRLGIDPLPEEGEYFLSLSQYVDRIKAGQEPGAEHVVADDEERAQEKLKTIFDQEMASYERIWKAAEFPVIAGWISKNNDSLDHLLPATKRSRFYSPLVPTDQKHRSVITVELSAMMTARDIGRAYIARAMLQLGEGKIAEAEADLLACHRLGRLVAQGETVVESLVGIAIDGMARTGDLVLANSGKLTSQQLLAYLAEIKALPPAASIIERINFAERIFFVDSVLLVAKTGSTEIFEYSSDDTAGAVFQKVLAFGVDWNVVLKFGQSWYDRFVAIGRETDMDKQKAALAAIDVDIKKLSGNATNLKLLTIDTLTKGLQVAVTDRAGILLVSLFLPALNNVILAEHRHEVNQELEYLALALAAYRADHDKYPEELTQLAPMYLAEVPLDRFSGKSFLYKLDKEGYLLYSIGPNGEDDEGRSIYVDEGEAVIGDDLAVKVGP